MRNIAGSSTRDQDDESEIDMTPMLDVVFIMLIFFIVTASFLKEKGLDANRPDPTPPDTPPPESTSIVIDVTNTGEVWISGSSGKRRIDIRSVRANVERLHAENPEGGVVINASPKADMDKIVTIIDSSRQAGVYSVALAGGE
mgnify:CR=1 FL=1